MADYAAPGESLIYEIGCHKPAPAQRSNPTFPEYNDHEHQPHAAAVVGVSPWETCMNRRVVCKDGFVRTTPFHATCQPSPAAAVQTRCEGDSVNSLIRGVVGHSNATDGG
jgi:hypothetical protein